MGSWSAHVESVAEAVAAAIEQAAPATCLVGDLGWHIHVRFRDGKRAHLRLQGKKHACGYDYLPGFAPSACPSCGEAIEDGKAR